MQRINDLPQWQALESHHKQLANQRMSNWFETDPARFDQFSIKVGDLLLDYSKNRITYQTIQLLSELAFASGLPSKIEALFNGEPVNHSENRPALHTALRDKTTSTLLVDQQNIIPGVRMTLTQMQQFSDLIRQGLWLGSTLRPITQIVNIGIGGSHLGPLLTTRALSHFAKPALECYFISNIDSAHTNEIFEQLNPETTLFIISSKSFSTLETLHNANTAKEWLETKLGTSKIQPHFIAITAATEKAVQFGIPEQQIFPLWDWVGGRYSIWSAIGLPLAIMIGMDGFMSFLDGAYAMDQHFRYTEFSANMPVMMGLLGIWYINFFDAAHHAIIPYAHQLNELPSYLQQADMESNGKIASRCGMPLSYSTGPIVWGGQGCNGQHAFHQLLHQGHHLVPVDFILLGSGSPMLVASGLSQAQALMHGKSHEEALQEMLAAGYPADEANRLALHKAIPGNRPSNTLFLNKLTPYTLGALLALYEHKIFVQGAIWDINSFDQWGVELGKQLLPTILADLNTVETSSKHDASTHGLIQHYRQLQQDEMAELALLIEAIRSTA